MSSEHRQPAPPARPSEELSDESDFETIVSSSDGLISICGFGSLLSGTIKLHFIMIITITQCFVVLFEF
jgi:hypothetical protein